MQVEILEEKLSSDGFGGSKGDRFTVPDEVGSRWCAAGWAKDMSGNVATGERNIKPITVNPKKITQSNQVQEVK